MVSDRLKDFIFKKLYKDLSRVEIIHYKTYIWFIDREDKCWYFRYDKSDGTLLWRYYFFMDFFTLFTMNSIEFVPVISSWVEEVINNKVTISLNKMTSFPDDIENALNCKMVEEVINHKVSFDLGYSISTLCEVEDVLNHKVGLTLGPSLPQYEMVDEVLNYKVTKTDGAIAWSGPIEEALNNKVNTTEDEIDNNIRDHLLNLQLAIRPSYDR